MDVPITQSKAWERLQNDLNTPCYSREGQDYQFLALKKSTPLGSYLYLPYGPVAKTKAAFKNALSEIEQLARGQHAFFIRLEPQNPKFVQNLPKTALKSTDLNPAETWLLDLTGNETDLKNRLPSRLLRYYKNREKNRLTLETSHNPDDITHLLTLQKSLAKEKGINTFSEHYLKTELAQPFATLYLLKQDQTILAAGLVFDDETTRYNLQGAQSPEGKKLHATGILTIKLILDAAAKGLKTFDFWGIAPEGAPETHPWAGFTAFKKTFAGSEKIYAGTYDLPLSPGKYKLYQFLRKIRRSL